MGKDVPKAIEALVEGLISDPLVELVMKADGVSREQARSVLADVCASLAARTDGPAPDDGIAFSHSRSNEFRTGVGILLFNANGDVFVGQRNDVDSEAWQMPQGGVDEDEHPLSAALRELREEIGTDNVALIAESKGWLRYEWPPEVARKLWDGRWRGQQLKWFAMRFVGQDDEIDVATAHPEFSAWRWATLEELPSLIVAFKRPVYEQVVGLFSSAMGPGGKTGEA
jgi:putative (di)nucleoside polyphosphate hydrolase